MQVDRNPPPGGDRVRFPFENPAFARRARRALAGADPTMRRIVAAVGAFTPDTLRRTFDALVYSVIHQQLSMKAARTICTRLRRSCPGGRLTPRGLAGLTDKTLRAAGLSRQKVSYLRSICGHFAERRVRPQQLRCWPDDVVRERLVAIRGVGVWTAEMILIFNLQRPDVWPVDDLGLQQALHRWYRVPLSAPPARRIQVGERFRPYRSVATWYLWRSLGGELLPGFRKR